MSLVESCLALALLAVLAAGLGLAARGLKAQHREVLSAYERNWSWRAK